MEREDRMQVLFQDLIREERPVGRQTEVIRPQISEIPYRANEAINILRGNIQLSGNDIRTIAVTSAVAHEGKSSIAFRLAKSLAALEKRVLFLDCDIRNSNTQIRYQIPGKKNGLSEYLCGSVEKDRIIYRTDDPYMDMVFTGAVAPNPSELISGELFQNFMTFVRSIYDYIIVDTPPLNLVIDGLLIAKQCDGAVLVVESGLTERAQMEKARRQMLYADIKILGAVLNKARTGSGRYGYGYGYGYGHYGHRHQDEEAEEQSKAQKKRNKR